jgi:hypothetical protein
VRHRTLELNVETRGAKVDKTSAETENEEHGSYRVSGA